MLENHVLNIKSQDNRDNDSAHCNSEPECRLVINQTPPNVKKFFMRYRFGSPIVLGKSIPRRHKALFRYGINRSLNFDIRTKKSNCRNSSNSSLDNSFDANGSLRDLSRSAKIMRALSIDHNLFHHRNANIKRSLNFDSTPSPKRSGSSNSDGSIHTNSKNSSPSPMSDKVLRLNTSSTDSSPNSILIASLESIDENQNRTPQQNRKIIGYNTDKSGSSSSTSLLRSNLKERIDNIVYIARATDLQSFKRDGISRRTIGYDVVTSTPRNLFQEFNEVECDRPHTPENTIRLIPESMSAIKKSHKKERSYRHEERFARQKDTLVKNESLHIRATVESLGIDDTSTNNGCNNTCTNQSRKKNAHVKKTLVYNFDDKFSETESVSEQQDTSRNIEDSDNICLTDQEYLQDGISPSIMKYKDQDTDEEDGSNGNISNEEECRLLLQKESPNAYDADVTDQGNNVVSLESNQSIPQNAVVTPENHVNISQRIFTESIKKSHRKIKHGNRKALFKSMVLYNEVTKSEMLNVHSIRNNDDNQCIDTNNSTSINITHNPRNSVRSHTPENVNSSRLLLSQFSSIKKSHRKNKRLRKEVNKRISSLTGSHDDYHKRNVDISQGDKYEEESNSKVLCTTESPHLKESSSSVPPIKKKRAMNLTLPSDKLLNSVATLSPNCKNMDTEFKIYTPIRRRRTSTLAAIANCADESASPERDDSAQTTSKKVDFSRCETPIIHCFYRAESRENESFTREERVNTDRSENDAYIISSSGPRNITTHWENGRSTPLNMSTMELLCNIDSIKKSHKKNKHTNSVCKREILAKKQLYARKTGDTNFANDADMENHAIPSLKLNLDGDIDCAEMGACSNNKHNDDNKGREVNAYDDSQPSTSGKSDGIESNRNAGTLKLLNTTPPNSWNSANFVKLLRTASIKKSHKKERNRNAQAKYIFMSEEHDLSDDGSIFNEEDRLTSIESID